jgi:hypothetical protein
MSEKFKVGEKIIVKPSVDEAPSTRDVALESFDGQTGEVLGFYSLSPTPGQVFYIYTVAIGSGSKKVVLHEDEIEAQTAQPLGGRRRR